MDAEDVNYTDFVNASTDTTVVNTSFRFGDKESAELIGSLTENPYSVISALGIKAYMSFKTYSANRITGSH